MWERNGMIGLAVLLAAAGLGAAPPPEADPEAGGVTGGQYDNPYFGLRYTLPDGWTPSLAGPKPSRNGDYVLMPLAAPAGQKALLQFGAQDLFFAKSPPSGALAAARALQASVSAIDGTQIDAEAKEITLSGRSAARIDYSGAGLYHAYVVTVLRCHLVGVTATATDRSELERLADSLDKLVLPAADEPACVKDYASPETVVQQSQPALSGAKFTKIPVRIVIGPDGAVRHVHVINAAPEQRAAIEAALKTWQFKPYRKDGAAAALETGLSFEVK